VTLAATTDIGPVLLAVTVVLVAAKACGEIAARLHQPVVVGEILAGILLGNPAFLGIEAPPFLRSEALDVLAEIGILVLLFQVGVEETVPRMLRTGASALLVATIGLVVPAALGAAASWAFFPAAPAATHAFVGSILCATSVGVTARVLRDLGRGATLEGRLVLAAAVVDDVLALIVLASVSGVIAAADAGRSLSVPAVAWIAARAVLFPLVAIPIGMWVAPRLFRLAGRAKAEGLLLPASLAFCFLLAYLADLVGLAPIVGAFTAGLILEERHFARLAARERRSLDDLLQPIASLLLPIFFVLIGMKVDARAFGDPRVLAFAGVLLAAAVVGKLASGLGALGGADRLAVGLGMVPRGEVGSIFAGIGATLRLRGEPVVPPVVFAAVVLVAILTTLLTPPALVARFARLPAVSPRSPPSRPGVAAPARRPRGE
jgi:Kef-type K+ transport system membrane component KefB